MNKIWGFMIVALIGPLNLCFRCNSPFLDLSGITLHKYLLVIEIFIPNVFKACELWCENALFCGFVMDGLFLFFSSIIILYWIIF